MSLADELGKLAALRDRGVITPAEFETTKVRLLERELDRPADRPAPSGLGDAPPDPMAPMPESNMVWAVLSTLFCVWPIGIVAIVKASRVANLWYHGRYGDARDAAESARKWSIASAVVGAVLVAIVLIVVAATGGRAWRNLF